MAMRCLPRFRRRCNGAPDLDARENDFGSGEHLEEPLAFHGGPGDVARFSPQTTA